MNLINFLQKLVLKGWKFWCDKGRIGYSAPDWDEAEILTKIKENRSQILQLLENNPEVLNISPLSKGQKALWFIWNLEPDNSAYNQVYYTRIGSTLNTANLILAFQKLLKRHDSLRSTFTKIGLEPVRKIHQNVEVDWQQIDASTWGEKELKSQVHQESKRSFDLESGPMLRVRLFTCSPQEHILLLILHHIVTDGRSLTILLSELRELYQSIQKGITPLLSALDLSYADFVFSQQNLLEGLRGEKLWSYWREKLKGDLPNLNLPIDKPRPPVRTYNGSSYNFTLSSQLTERLQQFGGNRRFAPYSAASS